VVIGKFYLTPIDISTLSFRKQYFFNNAYHRLLKVNNYNPADINLTECHFLKLKNKDKYSVTTAVIDGGIANPIGDETVPLIGQYTSSPTDRNSYNTRTTTIQGTNNIVDRNAKNVDIIGDNNVVSSDTKNIVIQNGANNIIESNIENISLINTSNVTVTQSNVTYMDGKQIIASPLYGLYSQTVNSATITNSVVETSIVGSGVGSLTVPAKPCQNRRFNKCS
jgi:hypothetical protein